MELQEFRKLDYIIIYLIFSGFYIIQLVNLELSIVMGILVVNIIPAIILGTITNLIFRKKKSN